jgi:cytoskeletal protein CcmA (bactofilin family)
MAIFTEKGHGAPESETGLSIIGTGMRVVGDITAEGVVKIEGTVVGTVRAGRQVLVGKGGEVEGDVISREAIIGGEVRGSIRADERVEIQASCVVHGDIAAKRLLVQEGGEINGVVRMGETALEPETLEKAGAQRSY